MRARLTVSTVAAVSVLLIAGAGNGFAQGLDPSTDAAQQQYGVPNTNTPTPAPQADTLAEVAEVQSAPSQASQPAAESAPQVVQTPAATPSEPVEQRSGELPFTGFAALGVLLLGMALLGGGFVLRRTTRAPRMQA